MCMPGGGGGRGAYDTMKQVDAKGNATPAAMAAYQGALAANSGDTNAQRATRNALLRNAPAGSSWKTNTVNGLPMSRSLVGPVAASVKAAAVKPVVKTPVIAVKPTQKVTNGPGPVVSRRREGIYGNVARWGESYYRSNMDEGDDAIAKLGKGKYVGGKSAKTFGATA